MRLTLILDGLKRVNLDDRNELSIGLLYSSSVRGSLALGKVDASFKDAAFDTLVVSKAVLITAISANRRSFTKPICYVALLLLFK